MNVCSALLLVSAIATPLLAQDTPTPPKRSMAEGLVRQWIEREHYAPPHLESGLEVGAGKGPMVLLIRKADGTLLLHELGRGAGDHGPAARETTLEQPGEQEFEVPGPPKNLPRARDKTVKAAVTLRIGRKGDHVSLGTPSDPPLLAGQSLDRKRLAEIAREQFERTRDSRFEGHLLLEVAPDALMQDVLTTWEMARAAGFTTLMLNPIGENDIIADADSELIRGLPEQFGWQVEHKGPDGIQPICAGELLILLDGPARVRDVAPLVREFAKAGIWEIGFVGQRDARTRFKLPTHLPFDAGLR